MSEEKEKSFTPFPENEEPDFPSGTKLGGSNYKNSEYVLNVLEIIERKLPIVASLISVIGYIIISAFGKMNSVKKYFGYLFFLIISFGFLYIGRDNYLSFILYWIYAEYFQMPCAINIILNLFSFLSSRIPRSG